MRSKGILPEDVEDEGDVVSLLKRVAFSKSERLFLFLRTT